MKHSDDASTGQNSSSEYPPLSLALTHRPPKPIYRPLTNVVWEVLSARSELGTAQQALKAAYRKALTTLVLRALRNESPYDQMNDDEFTRSCQKLHDVDKRRKVESLGKVASQKIMVGYFKGIGFERSELASALFRRQPKIQNIEHNSDLPKELIKAIFSEDVEKLSTIVVSNPTFHENVAAMYSALTIAEIIKDPDPEYVVEVLHKWLPSFQDIHNTSIDEIEGTLNNYLVILQAMKPGTNAPFSDMDLLQADQVPARHSQEQTYQLPPVDDSQTLNSEKTAVLKPKKEAQLDPPKKAELRGRSLTYLQNPKRIDSILDEFARQFGLTLEEIVILYQAGGKTAVDQNHSSSRAYQTAHEGGIHAIEQKIQSPPPHLVCIHLKQYNEYHTLPLKIYKGFFRRLAWLANNLAALPESVEPLWVRILSK